MDHCVWGGGGERGGGGGVGRGVEFLPSVNTLRFLRGNLTNRAKMTPACYLLWAFSIVCGTPDRCVPHAPLSPPLQVRSQDWSGGGQQVQI